MYAAEICFANALSVELDPIWSTSTELDIVVNVVIDVISWEEDRTTALLLVLAVALVIFEFFVDTFVNFSKDAYKASRIFFRALELVLQVAMYTIDLSS